MRHFLKGFLYGVLGISLLFLAWLMVLRPQLTKRDAAALKERFALEISGADSPGDSSGQAPGVDIVSMQKQYPDIKAWLTIPGTVIDYPVLQSGASDPEHYLRRNYDHSWRMAGSLFFQYDCVNSSRNLVIYGHNMSDGSMFASLDEMLDPAYRREHEQILLYTEDGAHHYRVATVLKADTSMLPFNRTIFQDDQDFLQFAAQLLLNTEFTARKDMRLLTLVTCAYDWEGARTVVVAVELHDQRSNQQL